MGTIEWYDKFIIVRINQLPIPGIMLTGKEGVIHLDLCATRMACRLADLEDDDYKDFRRISRTRNTLKEYIQDTLLVEHEPKDFEVEKIIDQILALLHEEG